MINDMKHFCTNLDSCVCIFKDTAKIISKMNDRFLYKVKKDLKRNLFDKPKEE